MKLQQKAMEISLKKTKINGILTKINKNLNP